MTDNDMGAFVTLMFQIAECCAGEKPTAEKVEMYRIALMDMELKQIAENWMVYFNSADPVYFPSPARLRNPILEKDAALLREQEAATAFEKIKCYLDMYDPEFHKTCLEAIRLRMVRRKEEYLFPILMQWGNEIIDSPPGVVRAQFIKALVAENTIAAHKKELPAGKSQSLDSLVTGITKGLLQEKTDA